jgi:Rho termination factor, N-terminal domain
MPGGRKPGPSVKDDKVYEKVRGQGASKEKAARIANAAAGSGRKAVGKRGGKAGSYDDMTKSELYDRAKKVGIDGRSSMSKSQLINALRHH